MTLPFNGKVVNDMPIGADNFRYCNFIGYLNPYGEDIDYSRPFGLGGHDNNPTTDLFMRYFYLRETYFENAYFKVSLDEKLKYEKERGIRYYEDIKLYMERIHDDIMCRKEYDMSFKWELLDYDLLTFLLNCYSNDSFVNGFGKECTMMGREEYDEKIFEYIDEERKRLYPRKEGESAQSYHYRVPPRYDFSRSYDSYERRLKLAKFKDVMVQYMGYHYVARTPRTIYTSEPNIYETFYNYILNDFTIYQLPKMVYNPDEKRYIERINEFLKPEREAILKQETESIKRMVKREDRDRYYR